MPQNRFLALILLAGSPAFAVDSQLLSLVMPDAKVLAGINVSSARNSAFGQYLLSRIPASDQGLQTLISTTGFDPRQDLQEILMASAAQSNSTSGLVLARGSFDSTKITAALPGQQAQNYDGATLITPNGGNNRGAVAFIGNSIALIGDPASVKAALDRQNNPVSINPNLSAQAQTLSAANDAWSISLASPASLFPGGSMAQASSSQVSALVRNIQSSSGGVKFGDGSAQFTGQAVADTPDNANALMDVIRLIATMMAANAGTDRNPQIALIAQLLPTLQITTEGQAVNLALTVPETQLEALVNTASPGPGSHGVDSRAHRQRN
jgi:hypothetical protein